MNLNLKTLAGVFVLTGLFRWSGVALGAENLISSCEPLLGPSAIYVPIDSEYKVLLKPNQILIRGQLEDFWETGMEERTGWSIVDELVKHRVFRSGYDGLYVLENGDPLFLIGADGKVFEHGYFYERRHKRKVRILDREITVYPNSPYISEHPGRRRAKIPSEKLANYFIEGVQAVAVKTLSERRLVDLRRDLLPQIRAHIRSQKNPQRLVNEKGEVIDQVAHYERLISGVLRFEETAPKEVPDQAALLLTIDDGTQVHSTQFYDRLIVYDSSGQVIYHERLTSFPLISRYDRNGRDLLPIFRNADRAFLIQAQ